MDSIVGAADLLPHRLKSGCLTTLRDVAGIPRLHDVQRVRPV